MVKSMTGFGKGEYSDGKRSITCEIKTVNHRYADITVKMPHRYSFAEEKIKSAIKETLNRGKTEVYITVENISDSDICIKLNDDLAGQYYGSLKNLKEQYGLSGEISISLLASMPDVIKPLSDVEDEDEITAALLAAARDAAKKLDKMRTVEGAKLAEDLLMRSKLICSYVDTIDGRCPLVVKAYSERLRERIAELVGDSVEIPEERIATEAAIFADKCNITEELVRLRSHMAQFDTIIKNGSGADGKKLDFLVQEMNREANTIGSKANDLEITNTMLEIKAEIEKIREQIQNIE